MSERADGGGTAAGPRHFVGVAGWSYSDWEGIVYPAGKIDQLAHIARYFDVVELNTTFYHPAPPKNIESWLRRVEPFPDFQFTAKLWQRLTHDLAPYGGAEIEQVRPALDALAAAGRLGAVLLQFPYSFKRDVKEHRDRLIRLLDDFSGLPLVVEIRHASFNTAKFFSYLGGRGAGFCNIDQPQISRSIAPTEIATADVGYVRLHGRNYKEWFSENANRTTRYDYYYSAGELEEWVRRIAKIGSRSKAVFIIANNHYRGQAPANALRLKSMLVGTTVAAPASLVAAFPDLKDATHC